uniref:Uncharacterized protein n=1 Tax=Cacopsylla melanoneura TaxID=428564 RepID=A0A8D9BI28_9HEMI
MPSGYKMNKKYEKEKRHRQRCSRFVRDRVVNLEESTAESTAKRVVEHTECGNVSRSGDYVCGSKAAETTKLARFEGCLLGLSGGWNSEDTGEGDEGSDDGEELHLVSERKVGKRSWANRGGKS